MKRKICISWDCSSDPIKMLAIKTTNLNNSQSPVACFTVLLLFMKMNMIFPSCLLLKWSQGNVQGILVAKRIFRIWQLDFKERIKRQYLPMGKKKFLKMITHHQGTKSGRILNNSLLLSRQFIWQSYHYLLCVFVSRWPKCWANPGITGGTEMLILPGWLWVGTYLPQQLGLLKLALASHRIITIHVWVVIDDVDLGESHIENKAAEWMDVFFPWIDMMFLEVWSEDLLNWNHLGICFNCLMGPTPGLFSKSLVIELRTVNFFKQDIF